MNQNSVAIAHVELDHEVSHVRALVTLQLNDLAAFLSLIYIHINAMLAL